MISIVVPVYNEEESLYKFHTELVSALSALKQKYEILYVDDGSTDESFKVLQKISRKDKKVSLFSFRKNEGKAEALSVGFAKAKGDVVVTLDADLQDKPSEIKKLIKKLQGGYDLVCGWRKERKDPVTKVAASKLFNGIAGAFWGLSLHDYNCGLKAYKKEAAKSVQLYGGMHRFIPLLVHQNGFRVTEVPVVHESRKYGKSKYGFSKLWKDLPDIFTMIFLSKYSTRPLHFFGTVGAILLGSGTILLTYLTIIWFLGESIGRRPLLFLGMLLVIAGLQVLFTGFLADLILNISHKNGNNNQERIQLKYQSK